MAPKIQARPLAFAIPAVGRTAILPQTVAPGVVVDINRKSEDFFNVGAGNMFNQYQEIRFYTVRRVTPDDERPEGWIVERPAAASSRKYGEYEVAAQFRTEHLRAALGFAATNAAAVLVHPYGEGWHAEMRTLMADGTWHRAWYSETQVNQFGARRAIKVHLGK